MTNLTEQFSQRPRPHTTAKPAEPVVATSDDNALSPQDFYRDLTERADVQRILTRLAQVKDGQP